MVFHVRGSSFFIIHAKSLYHVPFYHALINIGMNVLHWCLQASLRGSVEDSIIIQSDLWRTCFTWYSPCLQYAVAKSVDMLL